MKAKQLPSGNYRTQVVVGYDESGKRIVKSFTAPTELEALKLADDFKKGKDDEKNGNITVKKALELYIESRKAVIATSTLYGYESIAKC